MRSWVNSPLSLFIHGGFSTNWTRTTGVSASETWQPQSNIITNLCSILPVDPLVNMCLSLAESNIEIKSSGKNEETKTSFLQVLYNF